MELLRKFKETFFSILPIVVFVVIINFLLIPLGDLFPRFLTGSLLLFVGLTLFSFGADVALVPFGERLGSALVKKRSIPLMLVIGFFIGFIITIAEPDVTVLADQVVDINPAVNKTVFILLIGLSIGLFLDLGFFRTLKRWPMKWVYLIGYGLIFILAALFGGEFLSVSFDSGGATTGPMTVPVILALGIGVSHIVSGGEKEGGFGFVGVASMGPILIVLVLSIFLPDASSSAASSDLGAIGMTSLTSVLLFCLKETADAIVPLLAIFLLFQPLFFKGSARWVIKMLFGFVYTFVGVTLFLTGVKYGYINAGTYLGHQMIVQGYGGILIPLAFVIGAVIVFAEPSVQVLVKQVETVSAGHIKKSLVYVFLAVGVGLSVAFSIIRAMYGISMWYFIGPGYFLAVLLSFFCPQMFTGIAFDSGGVASGPMSTSFVLALAIGTSMGSGTDPMSDAFGLVGLIAMMPIVTVQILGIIVQIKERKSMKQQERSQK